MIISTSLSSSSSSSRPAASRRSPSPSKHHLGTIATQVGVLLARLGERAEEARRLVVRDVLVLLDVAGEGLQVLHDAGEQVARAFFTSFFFDSRTLLISFMSSFWLCVT